MWNQTSTRFSQIVGEQPTSAVTIAGALSGLGSSRVSDYDLPELRIEGGRPECDARLAGNVVPTSIWSARHDGSIAFVDDLERNTADVQDDPNGGGWFDTIHPDDRQRTLASWSSALRTGRPFHDVHRARERSGRYERFLVDGVAIRDDEGRTVCWIGAKTAIGDPEVDCVEPRRGHAVFAGSGRLDRSSDSSRHGLDQAPQRSALSAQPIYVGPKTNAGRRIDAPADGRCGAALATVARTQLGDREKLPRSRVSGGRGRAHRFAEMPGPQVVTRSARQRAAGRSVGRPWNSSRAGAGLLALAVRGGPCEDRRQSTDSADVRAATTHRSPAKVAARTREPVHRRTYGGANKAHKPCESRRTDEDAFRGPISRQRRNVPARIPVEAAYNPGEGASPGPRAAPCGCRAQRRVSGATSFHDGIPALCGRISASLAPFTERQWRCDSLRPRTRPEFSTGRRSGPNLPCSSPGKRGRLRAFTAIYRA